MKVVFKDNKIIVFLNKKLDLDKVNLDIYFKKLFLRIKNKYNLELNGYYDINVYIDNNYGSIIEIENEDLDYYNYFNQIDMEIKVNNTTFLYEIDYEYLDKELLSKSIVYKQNNKLYFKITDKSILNKIIECSKIIYGDRVKEIMKSSKKVII